MVTACLNNVEGILQVRNRVAKSIISMAYHQRVLIVQKPNFDNGNCNQSMEGVTVTPLTPFGINRLGLYNL